MQVDLDGVDKFKVLTDEQDFAAVSLPASLFESGEVAIVLQPKK